MHSSHLIRVATEQDAGPISHVHVESWRTTYKGIVPDTYLSALDESARATNWREWIGLGIHIFVAFQDDAIVGFISGGPIREKLEEYDAELFAIYLLEQAQRKGIGSALLRKLASQLKHDGFKSMAVWVLESNTSSRFYENTGAHRVISKEIEIGGVLLPVTAYGWSNLDAIVSVF